ncbi:TPA: DUF2591 family protein [Morganella morganii]|nr:DUF2591 family protein [Morganella morganii]
MNKHRDKSDFEVNKAVAEILIQSGFIIGIEYYDKHILVTDKYANNYPFDPCNNPADAMPIIIENGISLIKEDDHYIAASTDVGIEGYIGAHELMLYGLGWLSKDKNPCRAAMEVFLMMKDVENEK